MRNMTIFKNLVEEVVSEVLQEKLRNSFRFSDFGKLTNNKDMIEYAKTNLGKPLGQGSSRIVFALSSSKVLKIARFDSNDGIITKRGIAQNEAEVEIYTNPRMRPVVAKIYSYHPNFLWIVSELTYPASYNMFPKMIGIDASEFENFIGMAVMRKTRKAMNYNDAYKVLAEKISDLEKEISLLKKKINQLEEDIDDHKFDHDPILLQNKRSEMIGLTRDTSYKQRDLQELIQGYINIDKAKDKLKPLVDGLEYMRNHMGLNVNDIMNIDQYGLTSDGRILLVDYGFNDEIAKKLYNQ